MLPKPQMSNESEVGSKGVGNSPAGVEMVVHGDLTP